MRNLTTYLVIMTIVFIVVAMAISGFKDDTLALEQKQYCEMVHLYQQDSSVGWPDYKGRFAQDCNPDGTVKVQP